MRMGYLLTGETPKGESLPPGAAILWKDEERCTTGFSSTSTARWAISTGTCLGGFAEHWGAAYLRRHLRARLPPFRMLVGCVLDVLDAFAPPEDAADPLSRRQFRVRLPLAGWGRPRARSVPPARMAWHVVESNQFRRQRIHDFCRRLDTEPYSGGQRGRRRHARGARLGGILQRRPAHGPWSGLRQQHGYEARTGSSTGGSANEVVGPWQIGFKTPLESTPAPRPITPRSCAGRPGESKIVANGVCNWDAPTSWSAASSCWSRPVT